MVQSNRLASLKLKLPGLEETQPKKKKLYAESSRQSVRETVQQWRKVAAERRSVRKNREADDYLSVPPSLCIVKRNTVPERQKSTGSRRNSTPRGSIPSEKAGPVIVTHYPQSTRNSMNATQIETDQGVALCFHEPVRGSLNVERVSEGSETTNK